MPLSGKGKRVAGFVLVALLVPGGIPLALGALLAGRIWPARFTPFAPGGEQTP